MKKEKKELHEKWIEYNRNIAGNIDDPSFHSSRTGNSIGNIQIMLDRLNQIFMNRKLGKTKKSKK